GSRGVSTPPMTARLGSTMVSLPSLRSPRWSRGGTHMPGRRPPTRPPVQEAPASRRPTGECQGGLQGTDRLFVRKTARRVSRFVGQVDSPKTTPDPNDPPPTLGGSQPPSPYSISLPILRSAKQSAGDRSPTVPTRASSTRRSLTFVE